MNIQVDYPVKREKLEAIWDGTLLTATEKGYPAIFDEMVYWVFWIDDKVVAYTGSLVMPNKAFAFVGNTYIHKAWRNKGLYKFILNKRNESPFLRDIPKITIVNPIENVSNKSLIRVISLLGYKRIDCYSDVKDIMNYDLYKDIEHHEVWMLDN